MKMGRYIVATGIALAVTLTGCNQGTSGGPGAVPKKDTTNRMEPAKPVADTKVVQSDSTFTLDVPNMATSLKQGETKQVSISINRGDNMSQPVTLSFANVPPGISIEPASPTAAGGQKDVPVMITAKADATPGDFTVKVNGQPETGAVATNEFKISIAAI